MYAAFGGQEHRSMKDEARPARRARARPEDVDRPLSRREHLPVLDRRPVAEHRVGPCGKERGDQGRARMEGPVADRVHPSMKEMEPAGCEPPLDLPPGDAGGEELRPRHDAEPAGSQTSDQVVDGVLGAARRARTDLATTTVSKGAVDRTHAPRLPSTTAGSRPFRTIGTKKSQSRAAHVPP